MLRRCCFYSTIAILTLFVPAFLQTQGGNQLSELNEPPSRLRGVIEKFTQDNGAIVRLYTAQGSPARASKLRQLIEKQHSVMREAHLPRPQL